MALLEETASMKAGVEWGPVGRVAQDGVDDRRAGWWARGGGPEDVQELAATGYKVNKYAGPRTAIWEEGYDGESKSMRVKSIKSMMMGASPFSPSPPPLPPAPCPQPYPGGPCVKSNPKSPYYLLHLFTSSPNIFLPS
jgi:hypothetical protein